MAITVEFRDIPGFNGYYVSTDGMILSTRSQKGHARRVICQYSHSTGCWAVRLSRNGKSVHCKMHRLVAITYLANPDCKPQVNHINGDRYDNRVENLEWVTASENLMHRYRTLRKRGGRYRALSEKVTNDVPVIKDRIKRGEKLKSIARSYGVSASVISRINTGDRSCFKSYKPQDRCLL